MNKPTLLSKKCVSCGIERPLNSFLILKTQVGAQYGNICASCRQVQARHDNAKQDIDDASGTVDRHTIDNKTKVAIERDKKQQQKETEILNLEESIQDEEEKNRALEKKTAISSEEKKHRQAFLDSKPIKHSLARTREQPSQKNQEQQSHLAKEIQQKEHETTQQEINELNLNSPLSSPTDKLKHQSATFKHFLAWAGEGSAIAKNLTQLAQKNLSGQQKSPGYEPTIDELTKNINQPGSRKK